MYFLLFIYLLLLLLLLLLLSYDYYYYYCLTGMQRQIISTGDKVCVLILVPASSTVIKLDLSELQSLMVFPNLIRYLLLWLLISRGHVDG